MAQEDKKAKGGAGSERECFRCGSLIPLEDDEGLCPTCGTEYGRATIAMPALVKPLDFGAPTGPGDSAEFAPHQIDLAGPAFVTARAAKSNALLWVVAIVFILLALATAGVALVLLVTKAEAPEPSPPAPIEQPAADRPEATPEKVGGDEVAPPKAGGDEDDEAEGAPADSRTDSEE